MGVALLSRIGHHASDASVPAVDLVRPLDKDGAYFERLLVPVDFSGGSGAALVSAVRIAERWESDVVLFHAAGFDDNDEFLNSLGGYNWGRGDVVDEAVHHLRLFAETVMPGTSERVRYDAVRYDDPVRAVADACGRHHPSLVVLGLHSPHRRRMRRSTSERIARSIDLPVLFVS